MTHIDSDTLLKFVLQTLEEPESEVVRQHLSLCERCRATAQNVEEEVRVLANVEIPVGQSAPPPLPHSSNRFASILKVAAVLAVGFLLGYAAAQLTFPTTIITVQQRLIPKQIALPSTGYVPAKGVDLKTSRPM
jgi:hypothetical protein